MWEVDAPHVRNRFLVFACVSFSLMALALESSVLVRAQQGSTETKAPPAFTEPDAVGVMNALRNALESNNSGRFLKSFDPRRMPNYAVFRDQVAEFFHRYDAFIVRYQVTQISMDGEFGTLTANFEFDARPSDGVTPNVRKAVLLRLVLAWDSKQWRIVDLSPRTWLQ
jgi:hypothetical protein